MNRHPDQDNSSQPPAPDNQVAAALNNEGCDSANQLIALPDVMRRTALGRTSIYIKMQEGTFPLAVKIGSSSRWVLREIDDWIQALIRVRDSAARQRVN